MSEYTRFEARIRCMASGSEIVQWSSLSKGDREAIAWAVAEIDHLKTDLEEHRTAAEYYAAALGMCEAKLTHANNELAEARADIEHFIGDVKMQRTQEQVIDRLRNELAKAKEAIACLEAANTEFARIVAD